MSISENTIERLRSQLRQVIVDEASSVAARSELESLSGMIGGGADTKTEEQRILNDTSWLFSGIPCFEKTFPISHSYCTSRGVYVVQISTPPAWWPVDDDVPVIRYHLF